MASRDLEKEFDPTQWSKRFKDPKELLASHLEFGNRVSDSNRYAINCVLNFSYGDSFRQRIDMYGINLPRDAPLIVYMHGGFWQKMNKHTSAYVVKHFVENHAKVFVIDHDLAPDVALEEIVDQFEKAVESIFNYAVKHNSKSISLIGHASGAHLITYLFSEEMTKRLADKINFIKNIYLISGLYDVSELRLTKSANRNNMLSICDENNDRLSPVKHNFSHLKGSNINFHVYVGGEESKTMQKQSREFTAHLKLAKVHAHYKLMEGLDHYDIVEKLAEIDYEITQQIINDLA